MDIPFRALAGKRILIVGNPGTVHVGAHLNRAANVLGLRVQFLDTSQAFEGPYWLNKLNWWLRGHRPARLRAFSEQVVRVCKDFRPCWMLCTGLAPVNGDALANIGLLGVRRLNYLTDDPWNPAHRAPWFLEALPEYDAVFTPRRANIDDLHRAGCPIVNYLPFAFAAEVHFPEKPDTAEERFLFDSDVVFAGGADPDRLPYMTALVRAGFRLALYGGYWDRYQRTKAYARGHADPRMVRKAIGGAKVALCLVRRANRDGNSMRTFEVPAIGACMVAEDTADHREIFGRDLESIAYFRTIEEMVDRVRWLLEHDEERTRLAQVAHHRIVRGGNTYRERLFVMLKLSTSAIHHPYFDRQIADASGLEL